MLYAPMPYAPTGARNPQRGSGARPAVAQSSRSTLALPCHLVHNLAVPIEPTGAGRERGSSREESATWGLEHVPPSRSRRVRRSACGRARKRHDALSARRCACTGHLWGLARWGRQHERAAAHTCFRCVTLQTSAGWTGPHSRRRPAYRGSRVARLPAPILVWPSSLPDSAHSPYQ